MFSKSSSFYDHQLKKIARQARVPSIWQSRVWTWIGSTLREWCILPVSASRFGFFLHSDMSRIIAFILFFPCLFLFAMEYQQYVYHGQSMWPAFMACSLFWIPFWGFRFLWNAASMSEEEVGELNTCIQSHPVLLPIMVKWMKKRPFYQRRLGSLFLWAAESLEESQARDSRYQALCTKYNLSSETPLLHEHLWCRYGWLLLKESWEGFSGRVKAQDEAVENKASTTLIQAALNAELEKEKLEKVLPKASAQTSSPSRL